MNFLNRPFCPSVLWHCKMGYKACKICHQNDLFVSGGTLNLTHSLISRKILPRISLNKLQRKIMTDTNPEAVLKTSKRKNFIIFVVVNDSASHSQTVRYVLQKSVFPFLHTVKIHTTRLCCCFICFYIVHLSYFTVCLSIIQ